MVAGIDGSGTNLGDISIPGPEIIMPIDQLVVFNAYQSVDMDLPSDSYLPPDIASIDTAVVTPTQVDVLDPAGRLQRYIGNFIIPDLSNNVFLTSTVTAFKQFGSASPDSGLLYEFFGASVNLEFALDLIYAGKSYDVLEYIFKGGDSITGSNQRDVLLAFAGPDNVRGLLGPDSILGQEGDDFLNGNEGADSVDGGAGDDTLHGGRDGDRLIGGTGKDQLFGDFGSDLIYANEGSDTLDGGVGNDTLYGGKESDQLIGRIGKDQLFGDLGDDLLLGNEGDDTLDGGSGDDTLHGGKQDDQLIGGADNDQLFGDLGDDLLFGLQGVDALNGNAGNDISFGGSGADWFYLSQDNDLISDFSAAENDKILVLSSTPYQLVDAGGNLQIIRAEGITTLLGVELAGFDESTSIVLI